MSIYSSVLLQNMNSFCIIAIGLIIFIPIGLSISCYECSTLFNEEGGCGEEFDPEGLTITECNETEICMIHSAPAIMQMPEITQRGCIDEYFCNKVDEMNGHCVICAEDLCNNSFTMIPSFLVVVTYFFVICFSPI